MTTSSRVKALLEMTSTDQNAFAAAFGMTTPQAMSNKLRRDSWSAKDLAKLPPSAAQGWHSSSRMAPSLSSPRTRSDRYTTKHPALKRTILPARGVLLAYSCNRNPVSCNKRLHTKFVATKK